MNCIDRYREVPARLCTLNHFGHVTRLRTLLSGQGKRLTGITEKKFLKVLRYAVRVWTEWRL